MESDEPCNICGCTGKNLIDGFYYCVECGTQDANVQQTIIEFSTVGDGVPAVRSKKRITQIPQTKQIEMTDDWYKWHSLNFLLQGLADELIEVGAEETVKLKLLWIWTRYMKKFQNKADFGLAVNEELDDEQADAASSNDSNSSSDDDEHIKYTGVTYAKTNIKNISMHLVITCLYVALNLDKSPIQLTDLLRLIKEERISIINWQKLVPKELRPKKLSTCLLCDIQLINYSNNIIRILSMELFRELDLGNPVVPDLRLLVDRYLKELCLPNGLKPLVFSLMQYRSFDYLDVNTQYKDIKRIPAYELHAIAHILMALKICFGLDSEYEVKLSDAIDKLNEIEDYPISYNSEPTDRMFSFRDWAGYIHFRKTLLKRHTLYLGAPNYLDMNDYVTFEHLKDRKDYKKFLKDEITYSVINKIPSGDINVIPRSEFVPTLTPHVTYARVIMQYQQDRQVKELLSEDFTQYSVNYFMKDMFLVDPDSPNPKNLLTGVSDQNLHEHKKQFDCINPLYSFAKKMVFVKHCDNHNWTVTRRPQVEHVTNNDKNEDKEKDHGYVSNTEILQNVLKTEDNFDDTQKEDVVMTTNNETTNKDSPSITDIAMETEKKAKLDDTEMIVDSSSSNIDSEVKTLDEDVTFLKIQEEDADKNIFDDDFIYIDGKIEEDNELDEMEPEDTPVEISEIIQRRFNAYDRNVILTESWNRIENDSDVSSVDSILFNPETLDRTEVIKELIIHACDKYRVSIPGKYVYRSKRVDKPKPITRTKHGVRKMPNGAGAETISDLIAAYHSHIQHDILNQMSGMVQSAIADFNKTQDEAEIPMETDVPQVEDDIDADAPQSSAIGEDSNQNPETINEQTINDTVVDEYNLFADSSDGEVNAEDLLPKKNPDFDEKTHDITQLYIKPVENPNVPEMTLHPKLFDIVDKAIAADNNSELEASTQEKSDSEEELPLEVIQEQKRIRKQLTKQALRSKKRHFKLLLPADNIPKYNYWIRHYKNKISYTHYLRFSEEMDEKLPKSFVFVLKECADIVGYTPFLLYKSLQQIEKCIKDKFVQKKIFSQNYCESQKRCRMNRDF